MGRLSGDAITLRAPRRADAAAIHALVVRGGTLEANTAYCYLLLADHFASTCVVAEHEGAIVGFVLAYRPPSEPDAIFVWQVGVAPEMRGRGLGGRLLAACVRAPGAAGASRLIATVAPSNTASRALFAGLARSLGVTMTTEEGYPAALFADAHESEPLLVVGPLLARASDSSSVPSPAASARGRSSSAASARGRSSSAASARGSSSPAASARGGHETNEVTS